MAFEKILVLRALLWPANERKYHFAEGNVESVFASRLLTDFAEIPLDWIHHQYAIAGGFADIAVVVNDSVAMIVECKRAGEFVSKAASAVAMRKPLNQALGYSFTSGAPLVLVTDGRHLALVDRHKLVITASSREEILARSAELRSWLRPEYLYYCSRDIMPPVGAIEAIKLLGKAWSLELESDVELHLEKIRAEFADERNWSGFRDEVLSWLSLAQHYRRSSRLDSGKPNEIIHLDYSFVSYFEGSWYYDQLHHEVVARERELTKENPGFAFRIFVLRDKNQLAREREGLRMLLRHQLGAGYRCGLLYNEDWLTAGIVDSHVDIVGSVYAKVYFEVSNVLTGEVVHSREERKRLRSDVLDVVYHYGRIFEPLALDANVFEELDEWFAGESL